MMERLLWRPVLVKVLFWSLLAAALMINVLTLKDGHNWGDDFAQYILGAQNLTAGKPFLDPAMRAYNIVYPPLYSVFLMPWIKLFGLNFVLLKSLNVLLWMLGVWGVYRLVRLRSGREAARAVALLAAWSSYFFFYKQNLLADILFSVELIWAVFFFERYALKRASRWFHVFLVMACLGILTRAIGVSLFAAGGLCLILDRHKDGSFLKKLVWLSLSLGAVILIQNLLFGAAPGYFQRILEDPAGYFWGCVHHAGQPWRALAWCLVPGATVLTEVPARLIAGMPFLGVCLYGLTAAGLAFMTAGKRLSFAACVFGIYMAALFFWSWQYQSSYTFARFLLPVVGIVFYALAAVGRSFPGHLKSAGATLFRVIVAVVLFLNAWNILCNFGFNDDQIGRPAATEMFAWVRAHVKENDLVIFLRPRLLRLMTGVYVYSAGSAPALSENGDWYAIVHRHRTDPVRDYVLAAPPGIFQPVLSNDTFVIYRAASHEFHYPHLETMPVR